MIITKYEHSCLDITEGATRLLIDPGKFSNSLTDYKNIDAVVITHVHSDHFLINNIRKIIDANSDVKIFTVPQVAEHINFANVTTVKHGDEFTIKDFILQFYGGDHEFYKEYDNIAVLVNRKILHPGDSYTVPDEDFEVLAAPVSAPWLRVRDAADFIVKCRPRIAFPIHNILLSPQGEEIHYRALKTTLDKNNIEWRVIGIGGTIEA